MNKGVVSTIIPVFNRANLLVEAVQSVLDQSYGATEIIIVDDGSTDDTLSVAYKLAAQHTNIQVIEITNSGPGLAREAGRLKATGEFIQYLDSDDLLHPEKFQLQVERLNSKPECDVVYCRQQLCTMDGTVLNPQFMRSGEKQLTMFPAMLAGRLWGTPAPLYRKALLDKCGPWLSLANSEDWEYDCRAATYGVNLAFVDQTLVTGRIHDQHHFGDFSESSDKLRDRATAHLAIYGHATVALVDPACAEFRHFVRALFLLCRQCGAQGLVEESQSLFKTLSAHPQLPIKQSAQHYMYRVLTAFIGWKFAGELAAMLDRYRS